MCRFVGVTCLLLAAGAASSQDWPQFHGPLRDNRSTEAGLRRQWPEGGPPLLWRTEGLGHGFSTVAIVDGALYTTGDVGEDLIVTALDLSGQGLWRQKNGASFSRAYPGRRSTPTVTEGRLYCGSGNGDLTCFRADTGSPAWAVNSMQRFAGREAQWGVAESPLVVGPNVTCCPGGTDVPMAALDKDTGETRWTCAGVGDEHGYASAALVECGGLRQIVTMTAQSAIGVAADTGRLLWHHPH